MKHYTESETMMIQKLGLTESNFQPKNKLSTTNDENEIQTLRNRIQQLEDTLNSLLTTKNTSEE